MSFVVIRCPSCNTRWRAAADSSPRLSACPHCGGLITFPANPAGETPSGRTHFSDPVIDQLIGRQARRSRSQLGPLLMMGSTLFGAAVLWFVFSWYTGREPVRSVPEQASPLAVADAQRPAKHRTGRSVNPGTPQRTATRGATRPDDSAPDRSGEEGDEPGSRDTAVAGMTRADEIAEGSDANPREAIEKSSAEATENAQEPSPKAGDPAEALNMPVGRDFKHVPIQDVVNYLTETTGVSFQLDMKSLWFDQGTTKNMPVTIDSEKLTIREFLDQVVTKQMKAVYQVRGGKIVIVSRKAANRTASTDTP